MKTIFLATLLLIFTSAQAQTTVGESWKSYSVKDENFSVELPALPAMGSGRTYIGSRPQGRLEIQLSSYADGVVYAILVWERVPSKKPLDEFIKTQFYRYDYWDRSSVREITLDGVRGKSFLSTDKTNGMTQFFVTKDRFYKFTAYGAPLDDARMTRFFSSISLARKEDSIEVSDGPGHPITPAVTQDTNTPEKIYKEKDVDRTIHLGMTVQASSTEVAKDEGTSGRVVLKCIFAANGEVIVVRPIAGLPWGLTEKAIEATKSIRFVPAMKDGRFVSMWLDVEYSFTQYGTFF